MGCNGEKKPNVQLNVHLLFDTHTNQQRVDLTTDENGKILLGKLDGCSQVIVNGQSIDQSFNLKRGSQNASLPRELMVVEQE